MEEFMYELEKINDMAKWVRSVEINTLKIGYIDPKHYNSFNSTISRENRKYRQNGEDKWLWHKFNKKQNRVAVWAMTRTEHEESLKQIDNNDEEYKKKVPEGFFAPEERWCEGSWHARRA